MRIALPVVAGASAVAVPPSGKVCLFLLAGTPGVFATSSAFPLEAVERLANGNSPIAAVNVAAGAQGGGFPGRAVA